MQRKLEEKSEELEYYTMKVTKIETENKELKLSRNSNKRIQELEELVEQLRG